MTRAFGSFARNSLIVAAFNTLVAISIGLVQREETFVDNLVYSQCIGLSVYLSIDLTRRAFWPRGTGSLVVLLALAAFGIGVGYFGGSALAARLLGSPWHPGMIGRADQARALVVTIWGGLLGSWFFWSRARLANLRAQSEAIERRATQARLKLLQAQIEPHFLFNTLANLHTLIGIDPPRAQEMLEHLNDYLRAALVATRRDTATLGDEFALLRGYLEVLAVRMGPRLAFSLDLPEPLTRQPFPPMLLQPLVENAVKHGLEPKVDGGRVEVVARAEADKLVITVRDTGLGLESKTADGTGMGLEHVRERLAASYGGAAEMEIAGHAAHGATVKLTLPLAGGPPGTLHDS